MRHRVGVGQDRAVLWGLALVGFPLLGAALFTALVWFDSDTSDILFDQWVRFSPALALPGLATAAVLRARRTPIGLSVVLIVGATVLTFVYAAVPVLWFFFSGVG